MTSIDQSFSARQVPWAKIGTIIDDPSVDSATAARLGGIDFDVELHETGYWTEHEVIQDAEGNQVFIDRDGNHVEEEGFWTRVPSRRAVVREAPNDEWFSFVSTEYQPVQFGEAFAFMDSISSNFVAAGALSDGRKGFVVVQLPEHATLNVQIDGESDAHDLYVVLQTSHDLSKGIHVALMPLRNRCMNMLTLPSFNVNVPQSWSIRHVGDPHAKLVEAQTTLERASAYGDLFERMASQLGSVAIDNDDMRNIARRVLPNRLKTREEQVNAIVDRFANARTVGFHGTGWGAVNAMSEYQQWGRSTAVRTPQSEFISGLDGDTAKYVNKTAQLVMTRA